MSARDELKEAIALMDRNEKAMLLITLEAMAVAKSKSARTRRLNDFIRWFSEYNAARRNQPAGCVE